MPPVSGELNMICSSCARDNPEGSNYCLQCGAELGVAASCAELSEFEAMRSRLGLTGSEAGAESTPQAVSQTSLEAGPTAESSTGMSPRLAGALCYVLGWITGLVFSGIERKSVFVRFHAWQSVIVFGVIDAAIVGSGSILFASEGWTVRLIFGAALLILLFLVRPVLWLVLIIQAARGRTFRLPGAGQWAERRANT